MMVSQGSARTRRTSDIESITYTNIHTDDIAHRTSMFLRNWAEYGMCKIANHGDAVPEPCVIRTTSYSMSMSLSF